MVYLTTVTAWRFCFCARCPCVLASLPSRSLVWRLAFFAFALAALVPAALLLHSLVWLLGLFCLCARCPCVLAALLLRSPVWLLGLVTFALAALVCLPLCFCARLCGCLAFSQFCDPDRCSVSRRWSDPGVFRNSSYRFQCYYSAFLAKIVLHNC